MPSSNLEEAHELINLLLGPLETTKKDGVTSHFKAKVSEYRDKTGGGLEPCDDIHFDFVRCSIHALVNLKCQLKMSIESQEKDPESKEIKGNKPPADTLSISQSKAVSSLLQIVVAIGVYPNLIPGVAPPLDKRSRELLESSGKSEKSILERYKQLVFTLESLLELKNSRSLSTLIITKHLSDILCGLIQVSYAPLMKPNTEKQSNEEDEQKSIEVNDDAFVMTENLYERLSNDQKRFKSELEGMLNKTYQPLVVKNLLIIQSGIAGTEKNQKKPPKWYLKTIGNLLTDRLMSGDDGVMHVIRGVLDMGGDSSTYDWKKVSLVADVIGNPPQAKYGDTESYYARVCPQLIKMLSSQESNVNMIASTTIKTISERSLILSRRHLLDPLMAPLVTLAGEEGGEREAVAVSEQDIDDTIKNLFKIFVVGNDPSLMFVTHLEPVIVIIMNLFLSITFGPSHLRDPVKQLIERYLKYSDKETSLKMIRAFALDEVPETLQKRAKLPHKDCMFSNGDEGGVKLIRKVDSDQSFYISDDERSIVVQDLLEAVNDKRLSVDFFLSLMEDLTNSMSEEVLDEEDITLPEIKPGENLEQQVLDLESLLDASMHKMRRNLMVIRMLGLLSEDKSFQDDILKESDKMIRFVSASIKRASVEVLSGVKTSPMAIQSLNMSLSILSVHLTQKNVPVCDWEKMMEVVDDLKTLEDHEDIRISKMCSGLHKLVLTNGTVLEELKNLKEQTEQIKNTTDKMRTQAGELKDIKKKEENKTLDEKKAKLQQKAEEVKRQKEKRKIKNQTESSKYEAALFDVSDPLVPVQGHGLITLTQLLEDNDKETLENLDTIRILFQSNLEDDDTYIYLNAINGLVACARHCTEVVLDVLLKEFGLVGERKFENKEGEEALQMRTKVGEALVKITKELGDLTPVYRNMLLNSFFSVANDPVPLIRASALSNLGEVVKNLHFSLGGVEAELLMHLASSSRDSDAGVRGAAAMVLTMTLNGLGRDAFRVLESCLRDIYRELKLLCSTEKEESVLIHLRLALDEIDNIVRDFLTPDPKLEKKIYVLDPPPDCF